MSKHIIQDWLTECAALSPVEFHSFASSLKHNDEIISAIYDVLENAELNKIIIDQICNQFFTFYRSREIELERFTLQFLPSLIYIYLNSIAKGDKKSFSNVETLLVGIYNLEVVDEKGEPVTISFRLPSLAQSSIYHEPMSLAHASLTAAALRRLEECNIKLVSWGPLPQVETLNSQNRMKVVTGLIFVFNRHIGCLHKIALKYLCMVSSRIATQGFNMFKSAEKCLKATEFKHLHRIPVSSQFLLELMSGIYYAMYNDYGHLAMQAVEDIYNRSCFECYAEGLIVANAIKNSSHIIAAGQLSEAPMGISIPLSPATAVNQFVSKSMITNASFRTKKLPDDIPIIPKEESATGSEGKNLMSISEEKEDETLGLTPRGSSLRGKETVAKNLQKLGLGKKFKDGKSAKTNITGNKEVAEKRQVTSFKDKAITKSPLLQNGEFSQVEIVDAHSPLLSLGRKKNSIENGLGAAENGSGGFTESSLLKGNTAFINEGQVILTRSSQNSDGLDETVICLDSSPSSHKKFEDKPLMQVSSV